MKANILLAFSTWRLRRMGIRPNHRPRLRSRPRLVREEQNNLHFPDGSHLRRHSPHTQCLPRHSPRRPNPIHRLCRVHAHHHSTRSIPLPNTTAPGRLQPINSHWIPSSAPSTRPSIPSPTTSIISSFPPRRLRPASPSTAATTAPSRLAGSARLPGTGASYRACSFDWSTQY